MSQLPITDNHIHIDMKRGRGLEAVRDFQNAGGTHLFLVSLPSRHLGVSVKQPSDYQIVFKQTIETAARIREIGIEAFPVLGIHPVDMLYLSEENGIDKAAEIMCAGFEIAADYVRAGEAIALKSGRPHFETAPGIREASDRVISHVFELGQELHCAVQLHVEEMTPESLKSIAALAKNAGIPLEKVVNHHAAPLVTAAEAFGIYPSIPAAKDNIEKALEQGSRFLMETDYVDDPEKPGFVLGPKTVPKKTKKLIETYGEEPFWRVHRDIPSRIYDVEIEI